MTQSFKAAVLPAAGERLRIETIEAGPPQPGEVLVRIAAAALCHTDLEVIEGQLRYPTPIVLGHEAAGTIEAVGAASIQGGSANLSCCPGTRIAGGVSIASAASRSCARRISRIGPQAVTFEGTTRLSLRGSRCRR